MSQVVLVTRDPQQAMQWRAQLTAAREHEVVAITNSARSARGLLEQHHPRLVVCDLHLDAFNFPRGLRLGQADAVQGRPHRGLEVVAEVGGVVVHAHEDLGAAAGNAGSRLADQATGTGLLRRRDMAPAFQNNV